MNPAEALWSMYRRATKEEKAAVASYLATLEDIANAAHDLSNELEQSGYESDRYDTFEAALTALDEHP